MGFRKIVRLLCLVGIVLLAHRIVCRGLTFNILDEIYYSSDSVSYGLLSQLSWRSMEPVLESMPEEQTHPLPGIDWYTFSEDELEENERMDVVWKPEERRLAFVYSFYPRGRETGNRLMADIGYDVRTKQIIFYPARAYFGGKRSSTEDRRAVRHLLEESGMTEEEFNWQVEERFSELIFDNWLWENPGSEYQEKEGWGDIREARYTADRAEQEREIVRLLME